MKRAIVCMLTLLFTMALAGGALAQEEAQMSEEQMSNFQQADQDGDGNVTLEEYKTYVTNKAEEEYQSMDQDKSGNVGSMEWLQGAQEELGRRN